MNYLSGLEHSDLRRLDNRRTLTPQRAVAVLSANFSGKERARNRHGNLYRQRLGSGVPVLHIWFLTRGHYKLWAMNMFYHPQ